MDEEELMIVVDLMRDDWSRTTLLACSSAGDGVDTIRSMCGAGCWGTLDDLVLVGLYVYGFYCRVYKT